MQPAITFALGVFLGMAAYWLLSRATRSDSAAVARELLSQAEVQKTREVELLVGSIKDSVKAISAEVLSDSVKQLATSASQTLERHTAEGQQTLDGKKELIDQSLKGMNDELQRLSKVVTDLEAARERKMGELSAQLATAAEHATQLKGATDNIWAALSNTTARGQWGERMAEDILQLVGMKNGINYQKQVTSGAGGSRPDFTFLLPNGQKVNMDVKFPFNSYLKYLEAATDAERESSRSQFVRDVRTRVKEITVRDYIDPENGTVDYVLLFIPNERVYSFANECDLSLMDDALRQKVIVCSPYTLYAVLAVMRQAIDNFRMEQAAGEMLAVMGAFTKQWGEFVKSFDSLGKRITSVRAEYDALTGTRRNQLERQLRKLEDLREQRGIAAEVPLELSDLAALPAGEPIGGELQS
jgi:DNA recombination protein RmuC